VNGLLKAASADGSSAGAASPSKELEAAEQLQRASDSVVSFRQALPDSDMEAVEHLQRSQLLSAEAHFEELEDIAAQLQKVC
jgi:hypothetical protein